MIQVISDTPVEVKVTAAVHQHKWDSGRRVLVTRTSTCGPQRVSPRRVPCRELVASSPNYADKQQGRHTTATKSYPPAHHLTDHISSGYSFFPGFTLYLDSGLVTEWCQSPISGFGPLAKTVATTLADQIPRDPDT